MEKSQTRLHFLDIMINKSGSNVWVDISNKPTIQNDLFHLRQTTHGID